MPSSSWAVPLLAAGAVWIMLIRIGWLDIDGLLTFRGKDGRGDWIRTSDLHTPSVMRYQAALRPDLAGASRQGHHSRQGAAGGQVARRRRKGKTGKGGGRALTTMLPFPAPYLAAAPVCSPLPGY